MKQIGPQCTNRKKILDYINMALSGKNDGYNSPSMKENLGKEGELQMRRKGTASGTNGRLNLCWQYILRYFKCSFSIIRQFVL